MPGPRALLAIIATAVAIAALAPAAAAGVAPLQLAKLAAAPTVDSASLGDAVAVSGSTIVVGAPDTSGATSGAAYVYGIGDDGAVTQIARLTASNPQPGDLFGDSVAISGDTIVVTAAGVIPQSSFAGSNKQTAYVFQKPATGWRDATETARLTPALLPSGLIFAHKVAISGDTIAVAAVDPGSVSGIGRAYVFVKPSGGWTTMTQTAYLQPAGMASDKSSGAAIAIDGGTIALGSYGDDGGGSGRGVVHVFERPAGGWADSTGGVRLTASDGADNDLLGLSVGVSGDTVVAGAVGAGNGTGAAYVFVRPAGGWVAATQTAKLTVPGATIGDRVGSAVAIDANRIAISAFALNRAGGAWLYVRPAGGWVSATPTAALGTSDATTSDSYGFSIAQAGTTTAVGARSAGGGSWRGSAYVFTTRALPPTALAAASACATTLSFTAGASAGSPVTGYEQSIDGGAWVPVAPAATASPITIAGLARGATATVRLRAVTAEGAGFQSAGLAVAMPQPTACVSISRMRVSAKGVVTARVKVATPGTITLTGKRLGRASRITCRATAKAKKAGTIVVKCRPNRATRLRLRTGSLRAAMTATFVPAVGAMATATRNVVLPRRHAAAHR